MKRTVQFIVFPKSSIGYLTFLLWAKKVSFSILRLSMTFLGLEKKFFSPKVNWNVFFIDFSKNEVCLTELRYKNYFKMFKVERKMVKGKRSQFSQRCFQVYTISKKMKRYSVLNKLASQQFTYTCELVRLKILLQK